MKKPFLLAVGLVVGVAMGSLSATTATQVDLSAFSETEQYQLTNWWSEKWVEYYGSNTTVLPYGETGVMRDSDGGVIVKSITIRDNDGHERVITATAVICYDGHETVACN